MKKFAIVTDSSSGFKTGDLPNLYVTPLVITCTSKTEDNQTKIVSEYDGVLEQKELFSWLENKNCKVSTSQAPMGDLIKTIDPIADKYDDIFVLPIAGSVSGSENGWNLVAGDYNNVHVIHQYMGGPMLKMIIQDIYELSKTTELTEANVRQLVEDNKDKIFGYMIVEDIRAIGNSGRIGKLTSKILGSLKGKIIVSLNKDGMKFASLGFIYKRMISYIENHLEETLYNLSDKTIKTIMFIRNDYDNPQENVNNVINYFANKYAKENVKVMEEKMPCVLTSHAGKNAVIVMLQTK